MLHKGSSSIIFITYYIVQKAWVKIRCLLWHQPYTCLTVILHTFDETPDVFAEDDFTVDAETTVSGADAGDAVVVGHGETV